MLWNDLGSLGKEACWGDVQKSYPLQTVKPAAGFEDLSPRNIKEDVFFPYISKGKTFGGAMLTLDEAWNSCLAVRHLTLYG